MSKILPMLMLVASLGACASPATPSADAGPAAPASPGTNVLAGTPMAAYGHDLNKARNVQNIVDQQAAKQAQAIDAATGSSG